MFERAGERGVAKMISGLDQSAGGDPGAGQETLIGQLRDQLLGRQMGVLGAGHHPHDLRMLSARERIGRALMRAAAPILTVRLLSPAL